LFYVTILDGKRVSYALGPFLSHAGALEMVGALDRYAQQHYERQGAWFWSFGTARLEVPNGDYPRGKLNEVFAI
jgi:hypothetical protein